MAYKCFLKRDGVERDGVERAELEVETVIRMVVHSVRQAVANTFSTMAGMETVIGAESCFRDHCGVGQSIVGVIGWAGRWNGTGILECTPEFACCLANLMLGTTGAELCEEALDAIAEMANIIFGSMKTELEPQLGRMDLGIPTVIYGKEVCIYSSAETFTLLPVRIQQHDLRVKVFIPNGDSRHHSFSHHWAMTHSGTR